MKTKIWLVLGAAAVLLSACIPSVNPFYRAQDLVYEPGLLGEWQESGKTNDIEVWKFEAGTNKAYKLTIYEPQNKAGQMAAHLFKIKDAYFLDLIPADCKYDAQQAELVACAMFPGHLLAHVSQLQPELKLALFNFDWLQKYLESHPKALAHRREGDQILLTADTAALQRFVMAHLAQGELFNETGELVRKP